MAVFSFYKTDYSKLEYKLLKTRSSFGAFNSLGELQYLMKRDMLYKIPDFLSVEEAKQKARKVLFENFESRLSQAINSVQYFKKLGAHSRSHFIGLLRSNKIPVFCTKTNRLLWGPYAFERIVQDRLQNKLSRKQAKHILKNCNQNYEGVIELYQLY